MIKWLTTLLEKKLTKKKYEVYKLRWKKAKLEQIKSRNEKQNIV